MNASTSASVNRRHRRTARPARVEALESRTLLSAWTTVNTLQVAAGQRTGIWGMAADNAGNVYGVGRAVDSSGVWHGIVREQSTVNGVTSWSTVQDVPNAWFFSVTTDSAGDVFACGRYYNITNANWIVSERQAGRTAFTLVNDAPTGLWDQQLAAKGITLDSSGNVFVVGQAPVNVKHLGTQDQWLVRKETVAQLLAGRSSFTTVDDFSYGGTTSLAYAVTNIPSGASAGLYVVGTGGYTNGGMPPPTGHATWIVRKSTNGGSTWSTVDTFTYFSSAVGPNQAFAVCGDPAGNVYVAGYGVTSSLNGREVVRESSNGGTSWSSIEDFALSASQDNSWGPGIGTDSMGNVYVVDSLPDSSGLNHATVRTNAGGTWQTVDDYIGPTGIGASNTGFARDSFGNLYTGGGAFGPLFVRSLPAAPKNLTAAADAINSTSQIDLSWTNSAGGDESGFAIYRSTDGTNFSLVNTVGPSITTYADTGLSAGTTYYYYVTAVLNSVDSSPNGSSAPSNTASASTQSGGMAAPAASAAVFSSTQITTTTDPTSIFHHRKHRRG